MSNTTDKSPATLHHRHLLNRASSPTPSIFSKRRENSGISNTTFSTAIQTIVDASLDAAKGFSSSKLRVDLNSTGTPMSSLTSPISTLTSPKSSKAVKEMPSRVSSPQHISDFFDKDQIRGALQEIKRPNEKLQFIDLVINRRREIKELEEQHQFEKIKPLLKQFSDNFKRRRNEVIAYPEQASSIFAISRGPSILIEGDPEVSEFQVEPSNYEKRTTKRRDTLPKNSLENLRRIFMRTGLGKHEKQLQVESPALVNKTNSVKSPTGNVRRERQGSRAYRNDIQLKNENTIIANQSLENDLYKFLLKNEKGTATSLLVNPNKSRSPSIRQVERQAESRFDRFQDAKRRSINYLRSSTQLFGANVEKKNLNSYQPLKPQKKLSFVEMESPIKEEAPLKEKNTLTQSTNIPFSPNHRRGRSFVIPKSHKAHENLQNCWSTIE